MSNYKGSKICVLSSQLFFIAALFNYTWENYIESFSIFALYMTSINFHKKPTTINKFVDECMVKFSISISIVISLYHYNILPTISTIIITYMYYNRPDCKVPCIICNLYHAIFVHFIGFVGFMCIFYNKKI
jgi:hypothetical protein